MRRKNVPRLAAAFVVTVAGCGENPPDINHPPQPNITRGPDGKCYEEFGGNPPGQREIPCPASASAPSSSASVAPTTSSEAATKLPAAPEGWRVDRKEDGRCVAYGPDPCDHPGCNPPPPMRVACPPGK